MKTNIHAIAEHTEIEKLIIHSIEQSLYQASIVVGDEEHFLCDVNGELLRTRSLVEMLNLCQTVKTDTRVLRQDSAYDEMVGTPLKGENRLEVAISDMRLY